MPQTPDRRKAYARQYVARPDVKKKRAETYAKWLESNRSKKLESEARRRLERRASCLVATVRTRARKRGLPFDLDQHIGELQDRINKGACEMTGQLFDLSPGRKWNSPSVDRIDPKRGYTFNNVRLVLNIINVAMGDWGEETLKKVMGEWMLKMQSFPRSRRRSSAQP